MPDEEQPWLVLLHQHSPKSNYFRVKIWRRLGQLGAVSLKNSAYVLPRNDQTYEDFQWVVRDIAKNGGAASVCEARFLDGMTDDQVKGLFKAERDADYARIAKEARQVLAGRGHAEADLTRLKKRLEQTAAIDFFAAPGRAAAAKLLSAIEDKLRGKIQDREGGMANIKEAKDFRRRTWVTRTGIHVDRMASAWLIRRFIDPKAKFKFVPAKGYKPGPRELRFDMFEAEYTHEGDLCTFEVLIRRFGLGDPALRPIAEIIHDIDLKDSKYGRAETPGIALVVAGIAMAHKEDEARLERATSVFNDLHGYFLKKPEPAAGKERH